MSSLTPPVKQHDQPTLSAETTNDLNEDVFAFPTSFAQQRLWFFSQLAPESPFYNIPLGFTLTGALNITALECSLNEIVARHESLRTAFASLDGQPTQLIAPTLRLELPIIDLSHLEEAQRESETRRLAAAEAQAPFDLTRAPLLRCTLLVLDNREHVMLLTMHHIISDGWSVSILIRELTALYEANCRGVSASLPPLPVQYADFAIWQREWLQGEVHDRQLAYWKRQLDSMTTLQLPTDRPRPTMQSFRGGHEAIVLPEKLSAELRELSEREGATLFMTLLTAFQILLHRYTGQTDIIIGSPIANRNREEIEGLIGFFVNSLVMRTKIKGELSFRELLKGVKENTLEAYANQDVPFERLVEELHPARDLSRSPLFQVIFALQNAPVEVLELAGIKLAPLGGESGVGIFDAASLIPATRFDIELHLWEKPEGIAGGFLYSTDLFDAATIGRMSEHFEILLTSICRNPDQSVAELPLMSATEREQLLIQSRGLVTDFRHASAVHELFQEQATRTPDHIAVAFRDEEVTYGQLNERANRLAHYLRCQGVGCETLVGIAVERSVEMIVGLLAILKAGGAYLPLDPTYPRERLAFMLEDASVTTLITEEKLLGLLPSSTAQIVCLHRDAIKIAAEPAENLTTDVKGENLAYVMYTSGSTGKPKGICIEHRSINRLVLNTDYVQLNHTDRVGHASNISFDAATFEIWGALLNGARIVIIEKDVALAPREFAAEIERRGITTLFLTTALFNQIAREAPQAFRSLRHLLFGGEAVDPCPVREVLEKARPARLLHVYGPTETTTFASWHLIEDVSAEATTIPIGRPLANTQIYLLNERLEFVPTGSTGEIYIGGAGVARGYLNRPELNAERFIKDSFSSVEGARLYRTGDLGRRGREGAIEFLGRRDHQVKVRGFRIELGEIEAALREHAEVSESIVVVREDAPGDKRVVAYVVMTHAGQEGAGIVKTTELRRYLKQRLPEYMVPSTFVLIDELPLTPNGKVDRNALPSPDDARPALEETYVAPQSEVERAIATIWQETLRVEKIGLHDNFFDLGGHSLHAAKVYTKLSAALERDLSIVDLFIYPTINSLAKYLNSQKVASPAFASIHDRAQKQKETLNRRTQFMKQRRKTNERV